MIYNLDKFVFSIAVIAQCEDFYEGGPEASDLFEACTKNPGHPTFIPVKNFSNLAVQHTFPSLMKESKDSLNF